MSEHPHSCSKSPDVDTAILVQDGWSEDGRRIMREHLTAWLPIVCGHDLRATDPDCQHCHRHEK